MTAALAEHGVMTESTAKALLIWQIDDVMVMAVVEVEVVYC